jgi:hypothetical protein
MVTPSKKQCDYCRQEIAREVFVCRYCGQAQAPTPAAARSAPPGKPRLRTLLVLVAATAWVFLTMFASWWRSATPTRVERPKARLEVFGRRGARGIELVNHETEPLAGCVITVQDEWRAMIQTFKPGEVRRLTWEEFTSRTGAELPSIEGEHSRYATVACDSHRDTRRAVTLTFR